MQHRGHDICRQTGEEEVHRTEQGPLRCFIDLTKAFDKVNREASGRSWRDMAAQRSS